MKKFLAVVVVAVGTVVPATHALSETPKGFVTFTVDNINVAFYEQAFPVFVEHGLPATLYAQTRPVGVEPWDMTWEHIRTIHAAGWEIGAHSYSHEVHLSQADAATLDLELGAPAARIFREVGTYPKTFATPFGDFDERVLEHLRHYYDAHLMAWGNDGYNPLSGVDHYRIHRVEIMYTQTPQEVCGMMERAAREQQWLVFMLHGVVEENPSEYQISLATLKGVLDCTAELRAQGSLEVLTAAEALQRIPHAPSE